MLVDKSTIIESIKEIGPDEDGKISYYAVMKILEEAGPAVEYNTDDIARMNEALYGSYDPFF